MPRNPCKDIAFGHRTKWRQTLDTSGLERPSEADFPDFTSSVLPFACRTEAETLQKLMRERLGIKAGKPGFVVAPRLMIKPIS